MLFSEYLEYTSVDIITIEKKRFGAENLILNIREQYKNQGDTSLYRLLLTKQRKTHYFGLIHF